MKKCNALMESRDNLCMRIHIIH